MKFTCTKEHLDRALRYSAKAVAKNATLPIVQNITLTVRNDAILCVATNLDVGVRIVIGGKIEADGSAVIPPQLLVSFIASLDAGAKVTLQREVDFSVTVTSGTSRVKIKGFNPADFPPIPERASDKHRVAVRADVFRAMVSRVSVSVAKTEARPELTGVYMTFSSEQMHIVATDGFRLGEGIVAIDDGACHYNGDPIIVPMSAIAEVLHVLSDSNVDVIEMYIDDGQIFYNINGVAIVSRLIASTYPDYQQIIPTQHTTVVTVDRVVFEKILRLADVFANATTSDMRITVNAEENTLTVRAVSQERGENVSTIDAIVDGDAQDLFLNTRYVLDGVSRCGGEKVRIAFSNPTAPVVIRSATHEKFLYLVMPIRK